MKIEAAMRLATCQIVATPNSLTEKDLRRTPGLDELSNRDLEFWIKFLNTDPSACSDVLQFLVAIKQAQDGRHKPSPPAVLEASLSALKSLAKAKTYTNLYRGITLQENVSNYEVGGTFKFTSSWPSFWSQDRSWAEDFAEGEENSLLLQTKFRASDVLIDLNVVPFVLGPVGREPELLLKPNLPINCKILEIIE